MGRHRERAVVAARADLRDRLASNTPRAPLARPPIDSVPVDADETAYPSTDLPTMIVTPRWYYSGELGFSRGRQK